MMAYYDMQQQNPLHNTAQWWLGNPQFSPGNQSFGQGFGQAAYGQPYAYGGPHGQPNWWGQRQLSQHEVGDVVRQLVPLLPQILAQAQQPQAAFGLGYGGTGYGGYGQQRFLTQQDVNEVVRQILPIVPQIAGMLQGQTPLHAAALYGAFGQQGFGQQWPSGFGQTPFGQPGWPQLQAAFGNQHWGNQRQLSQQDIGEVVRQLLGAIPQVMSNLQSVHQQQRVI